MATMTPKELAAHLRREQWKGGHGLVLKPGEDRLYAHNVDHADWPHLLSQDEGHEHPTEG